ncbi:MAG: PAS domain-containing protein [Ferruginibacter sp.]
MSAEILSIPKSLQKDIDHSSYPGIAITETLINGFFTVDNQWTVTYWNKAAEKLLGVSSADILGKNLWEKFAAIIPLNFYTVYQKAFLSDIPIHFQEYWAEMGAWFDVVTYHNDGTLSVSFKSSNQRLPVHPQQQLRILNELYRYVTEVTNDCLWEWDLVTKEIFWIDGGHKKTFGYNIENALIPQSFWESRFHPADKERILEGLKKIILEGALTLWEDEYRFQKADGSYAFVHDRGHIIYDDERNAVRMIGASQDITVRKEAEMRLVEERLSKQREITDAVMTAQEKERADIGRELHDNLNQILVVANWNIGMAKTDKDKSDQYLDKSSAYIAEVIEQIRKISRTLIMQDAEYFSLSDHIKKLSEDIMAVQPLIIFFRKYDIEDEKDIDEKMQLDIFRIVQEQLNNILKHAAAAHAVITLKKQSGDIILNISDDGTGTDHSKQTNGVGMININSRVNFYGGSVSISSKPGEGYSLKIILPLKKALPPN